MSLQSLAELAAAAQLPWRAAWADELPRLQALVAEGNQRTNLVGDASPVGFGRHVVEALTVAKTAEQALGRIPATVVDVGAGAGLEAMVLAMAWPSAQVVAVEPRALRHAFIAATAAAMDLRNLTVRGCSLHAAGLGPTFDLATARAVWPPPEWLTRARGLLTPEGVVALHVKADFGAMAKGWRVLAQQPVVEVDFEAAASARPGPNLVVIAGVGRG